MQVNVLLMWLSCWDQTPLTCCDTCRVRSWYNRVVSTLWKSVIALTRLPCNVNYFFVPFPPTPSPCYFQHLTGCECLGCMWEAVGTRDKIAWLADVCQRCIGTLCWKLWPKCKLKRGAACKHVEWYFLSYRKHVHGLRDGAHDFPLENAKLCLLWQYRCNLVNVQLIAISIPTWSCTTVFPSCIQCLPRQKVLDPLTLDWFRRLYVGTSPAFSTIMRVNNVNVFKRLWTRV